MTELRPRRGGRRPSRSEKSKEFCLVLGIVQRFMVAMPLRLDVGRHLAGPGLRPRAAGGAHVVSLDIEGREPERIPAEIFVEIVIDESPVEGRIESDEDKRLTLAR